MSKKASRPAPRRPARRPAPPPAPPGPAVKAWAFGFNQKVRIARSLEEGVVRGRAEYPDRPESYWLDYRDGNSCAKSGWFDARELTAAD